MDAGISHHFHQAWTIEISDALNGGLLPPDKPLTVAAYYAAEPKTAYVEPVAVGDPLPGLPIFLNPDTYVPAPLETTYQATWARCPDALREAV